jgi:hypothetical protein
MKNKRKLGIWMCHSQIHLMEYNNETPIDMDNIPCIDKDGTNSSEPVIEFSEAQKAEIFRKQQEYKNLAVKILDYDEIILFGPIDAKKEFETYLETNVKFQLPSIEIKQTENMTEAQQLAFVQYHFLHHNRTNA